jgi:hypothetical protein
VLLMRQIARLMLVGSLIACGGDGLSTEPNARNIVTGVPVGWVTVGGTVGNYTLGVDRHTVHGGTTALVISGADSVSPGFRGVGQSVKADAYRGKRIRFSAWVLQQNLAGIDIGLWMRIDGPFVTQGFDNYSTRPLRGTTGWHEIEIILDVPTDAIGIAMGALMQGRGLFYVDDMKWEVVAANGPTTNQLAGETPTTFDAVSAYSIVTKSIPINLDFEMK